MQKFWQVWVAEPLEILWLSFDKPLTFKKRFAALPTKKKRGYKWRIILVEIVLSVISYILANIFLVANGYKFEVGWGLLYTTAALLLFGLCGRFEAIFAGIVMAVIGTSSLLSYGDLAKPSEIVLTSLICLAIAEGIFTRFSDNQNAELTNALTFSFFISGLLVCFNYWLKATGNGWLNFLIFSLVYITVAYRLPSYIVTALSVRKAWYKSLREPAHSLEFLRASKFYSNEAIILPLPETEKILRQAARYDWSATLKEFTWIIAERPSKAGMVKTIWLDIIGQDLKERKTLLDIAGAKERLDYLLPDRKIMGSEIIEKALATLEEVSEKAVEYCHKIGVEQDRTTLEEMQTILEKYQESLASNKKSSGGDNSTKKLFLEITQLWLLAIEKELVAIRRQVWQVI